MTDDFTLASTDLALGHVLVQARWPVLSEFLLNRYGWVMRVIEVYRPELRQQWLYGSGRTVGKLSEYGISARFARPALPVVTNAWTARVSAHGHLEGIIPAAAALDVVPLGADGRPWTRDDPWTPFVAALARDGAAHGLIHFHAPGKQVWDRPHLQLIEWSDVSFNLALPAAA